MSESTNRANSKPAPATYDIDLESDVLPLIKLARWASQAGAVLSEVQIWRTHAPEFDKTVSNLLGETPFPEMNNPGELVEGVLWLAADMVERHVRHAQG